MKIIFLILLLIPFLVMSQKITKNDVDNYVKNNNEQIVKEFESYFNIKIKSNINFETDDLTDYYDSDGGELGTCFIELNTIVINNNAKYDGYSMKDDKKKKGYFIKTVMLHEICHIYFAQLIDSIKTSKMEYRYGKKLSTFNSSSIEEGICEYSAYKLGELNIDNYFILKSNKQLYDTINHNDIKYEYSLIFVKDFLDRFNLKNGISIIIKNSPPTDEEFLESKIYYNRLIMSVLKF